MCEERKWSFSISFRDNLAQDLLINEKVKELQEETKNKSKNNNEILEEITDYHKLKSLLSKKLNRVL